MAELIALMGLGGIAMAMNENVQPNAFSVKKSADPLETVRPHLRDYLDGGDVYFVLGRPINQATAQLNDVLAPMSFPEQTPTYKYPDIAKNRASNIALHQANAPQYFFKQQEPLGISYGAPDKNNGYNIEVPLPHVSFQGDPGYSLANLNKKYVDRYELPRLPDYSGVHWSGHGEPTMNLRAELPNEADVPLNARNPYGPHGYYQQIHKNRLYDKVKEVGHIKPDVLKAPAWKRPSHEQWKTQMHRNHPLGVGLGKRLYS